MLKTKRRKRETPTFSRAISQALHTDRGQGKTTEQEGIGKERAMTDLKFSQKEKVHCKYENTEKHF